MCAQPDSIRAPCRDGKREFGVASGAARHQLTVPIGRRCDRPQATRGAKENLDWPTDSRSPSEAIVANPEARRLMPPQR